ncbi:helix-turn-helix transcriptional regulator [Microbacterium elymi]|uniref:LuxR C-terminal-related transcriptional regulator n=1 Tax=Microbacterium elymi TaxID=2909587 RepID=A0ABY5NKG0_9MICO|nr:LuxR C-terminal-related transcriptional regulator [Microbacterium elymi]UUT35652.1 LuxR C-terminal-related transcriptional regulator [Microbacterium elymi]
MAELPRRTRFPVAFGGMLRDGAVHVSAVAGARTRHLQGLIVAAGRGLGGRAVVETRPRLTLDYRTAKGITHDYDPMVLGEGIATLFAVPVIVAGSARGVLYCGSWGQAPVSDLAARPAFAIADDLAADLRSQEDARRTADQTMAPAVQEELRETYAELRRVAADVQDPQLRARLTQIETRLAALSAPSPGIRLDAGLSPREIDVLACAALGATNGDIALSLGLREGTVKSYLASAMSKLNASTRYSAVATARRAGILP